jgi:hypothetical protein
MNKFYKLVLSTIVVGFTFSSCTKEEEQKPKGAFENGIFVSNEGSYGNSNASVSFIDSKGNVSQNIFDATNNRPLGDVLQSITIYNDLAYLVVNNSNKVEIVDADTFEEVGFARVDGGRFAAGNNGKVYVSQWIDGSKGKVTVIDTKDFSTSEVTEGIGNGPEAVLSVNDEIWITNVGTYTLNPYVAIDDSTVSVINTLKGGVSNIILKDENGLVGYNPSSIIADYQGDIWVLAKGKWGASAMLFEIDATSKIIKNSVVLASNQKPSKIVLFGTNMYYGVAYGSTEIFKIDIENMVVPSIPFIKEDIDVVDTSAQYPTLPSLYGLGIDDEGNIYAGFAPDFSNNGFVKKYDMSGNEIAKYEVGIGPNGVVFN